MLAQFLEERKKSVLPPDLDTQQMGRILVALYRGLTADLVLGVKRAEVRQAWIEATARLLTGPPSKCSKE